MVKNQELAERIIETIPILIDAVFEAIFYLKERKIKEFQVFGMDINQTLFTIKQVARGEEEECFLELLKRCKNCLASLKRILIYAKEGQIERAESKLEFELLPLLRIAQIRFYYLGVIEGDKEKEKKFWEEEAVELCKNYYVEQGMKTGHYKYDITVYVVAFNNLEYTKLCVESVLKNIPRTLRCELILINHGSTDGTKEYFESIQPEKQVDIQINSLDGFVVPSMIAEGEFILNISNDVVISKNSIFLMFQCMKENDKVAYIVPTTPNISNLQAIQEKGMDYQTLEEFERKAEEYNKREPRREENRVRLLNPICMIRSEYWTNSNKTKAYAENVIGMKTVMFGDDATSLYFRRAGYKNILMKDIYCHHFGSKTFGKTGHNYLDGRKKFYDRYGVDAWEKGFCWNYFLFQKLICDKADTERILGINGGMGSDSLKIKEEIKERTGNTQATLINYTMEKRFLADLSGISDYACFVENWEVLLEGLKGNFDYIMVSGGLEGNRNYKKYLKQLEQYLVKDGIMIFQSSDKTQVDWYEQQHNNTERVENMDFLCCKEERQIQYCIFYKKTEGKGCLKGEIG